MGKTLLTECWVDFVALFFPKYCSGCSGGLVKGEQWLCTHCLAQMPQTDYHLDTTNSLLKRLQVRIPLAHAFALYKFSKSGIVQQVLHALKYKDQPELGIMLGRYYGEKLKQEEIHLAFDKIIAVPLHSSRKRRRGYNQSSKFAEGLSQVLGLPFSDHEVIRSVSTETQTRKSKLSRWHNVDEVFEVTPHAHIEGMRILLVDDVITTGATVEACANALLKANCKRLSIACIAEA